MAESGHLGTVLRLLLVLTESVQTGRGLVRCQLATGSFGLDGALVHPEEQSQLAALVIHAPVLTAVRDFCVSDIRAGAGSVRCLCRIRRRAGHAASQHEREQQSQEWLCHVVPLSTKCFKLVASVEILVD